ncbi:MAG: aminoglycoside phosphotransferase family protein [Dactylosporangium sp.]|nr:aminoglycoside phosphotransferase family protein [Dactylosporangium sp.]NNJ60517.1 aminoglycoside phosphotransferase family protein [Dactylosporangium sp.]
MKSITKRQLAPDEIQAVMRTAFGESGQVVSITEFTDGWFAGVYGVTLADGQDVVLKASPEPTLPMLRYEVDLAHAEIEFYRRATGAGVPVPAVRYADPDGGYLITDRLQGHSLHKIKETMSPAQVEGVYRNLGALAARLHTVTGGAFGYLRRDGRTRSDSWRTSFLAFIDDIVADAVEYDRKLPAPAPTIAQLVRRNADVLDEVREPVLVHFDLWDGNVFVRPTGGDGAGDGDGDGGYTIEGVIDGERTFYGDPIAEFVAMGALGDSTPGLLEGYFGEDRPLTDGERQRGHLCSVYLDLIMLTEGAVRGFDPAEHAGIHRWVFQRLEQTLDLL